MLILFGDEMWWRCKTKMNEHENDGQTSERATNEQQHTDLINSCKLRVAGLRWVATANIAYESEMNKNKNNVQTTTNF